MTQRPPLRSASMMIMVSHAVPLAARTVGHPSAGAATLRRCLVQQVEPRPGHYTRPRAYLPYQFDR